MKTEATVLDGYVRNGAGHLVPVGQVRPIDSERDALVKALTSEAEQLSASLAAFKKKALDNVDAFVELTGEKYGVRLGGKKGNVSLLSYDGALKVQRAYADRIDFGPELAAAKALIDGCIHRWSVGANPHIRVLVDRAFMTDKKGKLNTQLILGLMQYEIEDAEWQQAMQAIRDSIQVVASAVYVRFYKRRPQTDQYDAIVLDLAAL